MDSKKCENCIYFDNSKHKQDKRTEHAGICNKLGSITFLNETCKMFEPIQKTLNDIEVNEPIYVLPKSQMTMYEILNFIN